MCILLIWYGPFLAASETTTASKQPGRSNLTSDLKSVTPITYLSMCILFIWYGPFLAASEATTTSKQPRRSYLNVQVKLVTPIYYMTKFQGIFVSQILQLSEGDDNQSPLTCVAIAAGNNIEASKTEFRY